MPCSVRARVPHAPSPSSTRARPPCRLPRPPTACLPFIGDGSEELKHPLGAAEVADAIFVGPHHLGQQQQQQ